jgi:hypothetical protein
MKNKSAQSNTENALYIYQMELLMAIHGIKSHKGCIIQIRKRRKGWKNNQLYFDF